MRHGMLSLSTLHHKVTFLQAVHDPVGAPLHDRQQKKEMLVLPERSNPSRSAATRAEGFMGTVKWLLTESGQSPISVDSNDHRINR